MIWYDPLLPLLLPSCCPLRLLCFSAYWKSNYFFLFWIHLIPWIPPPKGSKCDHLDSGSSLHWKKERENLGFGVCRSYSTLHFTVRACCKLKKCSLFIGSCLSRVVYILNREVSLRNDCTLHANQNFCHHIWEILEILSPFKASFRKVVLHFS